MQSAQDRDFSRLLDLATYTIGLATAAAAVADLLSTQLTWYSPWESSVGRALALMLDPLMLQFLALLHCAYCCVPRARFWRGREHGSLFGVLHASVLIGTFLVGYYTLNTLVLKAHFLHPLSPPVHPESGFLLRWLGITTGGSPSGFAGRGVILLLLTASYTGYYYRAPGPHVPVLRRFHVATIIQGMLLLATCAMRVFDGRHRAYDVLLGGTIGTLAFWSACIFGLTFTRRVPRRQATDAAHLLGWLLGVIALLAFFMLNITQLSVIVLLVSLVVTVQWCRGQLMHLASGTDRRRSPARETFRC